MSNDQLIFLSIVIAVCIPTVIAYWAGYRDAKDKFGMIEKYIRNQWPDEWAAYKKGVSEGYAQGLRDGQENLA